MHFSEIDLLGLPAWTTSCTRTYHVLTTYRQCVSLFLLFIFLLSPPFVVLCFWFQDTAAWTKGLIIVVCFGCAHPAYTWPFRFRFVFFFQGFDKTNGQLDYWDDWDTFSFRLKLLYCVMENLHFSGRGGAVYSCSWSLTVVVWHCWGVTREFNHPHPPCLVLGVPR